MVLAFVSRAALSDPHALDGPGLEFRLAGVCDARFHGRRVEAGGTVAGGGCPSDGGACAAGEGGFDIVFLGGEVEGC